ncbi:MAG: hypothetical protein M1822_002456 [Bathelium mastoideum]|nr:MAG: hypothetical protein M1822_002456 [Bathelium mastoideum]
MADDSNVTADVPVTEKPVEEATTDAVTDPAQPEAAPTSTDPAAPKDAQNGAETTTNDDEKTQDATTIEDKVPNGEENAAAPQAEPSAGTKATPTSANKKEKRKSSSGVPEHKSKKLNKKKSMPTLNLSIQPGEYWWARMKGYPPWPAIVCDEEMLPETLLKTRPVSAARPDGSYRDDFLENNKNAKERTYPIMYLGTNEFSWMKNTDLAKIDMDEIKKEEQGKKPKSLWQAYQVAAEDHELAHFKGLLVQHEEAMNRDAEERNRKQAEKEEKAAKKAERAEKAEKRKSKGKAEDEDEEMEDPAKTPKTSTKLKLGSKQTPNGEASASKPTKPKKLVSKPEEDSPQDTEKPLSEAEMLEKRRKTVLYLRHRLQKGFLAREAPPKEEEMEIMHEFFTQLEGYADLELSILKATKIHKVLKAILKLASIPKEEEYKFMDRSNRLLQGWNKVLVGEDGKDDGEEGEKPEGTNGEKTEGEKGKENGEKEGGEEDVAMKDAKEEEEAKDETEKPSDAAEAEAVAA